MHDEPTSASCAYIGLGHMGRPVFDATHRYFLGNRWRVVAADLDPEKLAGLPVETARRPPHRVTLALQSHGPS